MSKPLGPYTPVVRAGDFIVVSGQGGLVDARRAVVAATWPHARCRTSLRWTLSYSAWNRRPGSALAARYSACCKARTGSAGTNPAAAGLVTWTLTEPFHNSNTHRRSSGPSLTGGYVVRSAQAVLRPPPTPTRHTPTSRITGYRARRSSNTIRRSPGRGGPLQFPPSPSIRSAPYTPGSPWAPALPGLPRLPWPSP